jgi:hypothetical protein
MFKIKAAILPLGKIAAHRSDLPHAIFMAQRQAGFRSTRQHAGKRFWGH